MNHLLPVVDPDEQLVRRAYAAFNVRDTAALDELLADDIELMVGGVHAVAGIFHGKREVFEWLAKLAALTHDTFWVELRHVQAERSRGITTLAGVHAERDGTRLEDANKHWFEIVDGRITRIVVAGGNDRAQNEFWSDRTETA